MDRSFQEREKGLQVPGAPEVGLGGELEARISAPRSGGPSGPQQTGPWKPHNSDRRLYLPCCDARQGSKQQEGGPDVGVWPPRMCSRKRP